MRIFSEKNNSWVEKIWRTNASQIYKLCQAWSSDQESAKDLFQEVALRFCKCKRFLNEEIPLRAWFGTVVRNAHYDMYRRTARIMPLSRLKEPMSTYDAFPEQAAVHYSDAHREFLASDELRYLMEELNPKERLVVELTFLGGISIEDAAKSLGVTRNIICKRRCAALSKMRVRKMLRDDGLKKRDAPSVLLDDLLTRKIEIS